MPTRAIVCLNCGSKGEIEVRGVNDTVSPARIFRHRGHNPFSGHMHFQCPACKIVLLVDPMAVLADDAAFLPSRRPSREPAERERTADSSPGEPAFQRIFQH